MTIIEVLFAIVILSGVMLSLSRFGQEFSKASRNAAYLATASDLAVGRIEVIRGHSDFNTLVSTFSGQTETAAVSGANPSMDGYDGYSRSTLIAIDSSGTGRLARITVSVTAPQLTSPVTKTLVLASY